MRAGFVFIMMLVGIVACVLPVALNVSIDFQDGVGAYDGACRKFHLRNSPPARRRQSYSGTFFAAVRIAFINSGRR
jgi:hypothetical protein